MSVKAEETQDPEYNDKLQHEGWKDLREKSRWCTDILFLVYGSFQLSIRLICFLGFVDSLLGYYDNRWILCSRDISKF